MSDVHGAEDGPEGTGRTEPRTTPKKLEPPRSAAALRELEGKAFTVVAFDLVFAAFLGRVTLTYSCTIPGKMIFLFCFNSSVAMMGSASSTRNVVWRCSLICRQPSAPLARTKLSRSR